MNTEWQAHLQQAGARIENNSVSHFTRPDEELKAAAGGLILADLSQSGLISVSGDDATEFLQGQFSNDIKQISATYSHLSAYCNPKGRILAGFRVFQRNDQYWLELPHGTLESTLKRLRMFVLRSKVTLEDSSDKLARFGFAGPDADTQLAKVIDTVPTDVDHATLSNNITVIRVPGPHPRFELHGESADLIPVWNSLAAAQTRPVGAESWGWLDTMAGIPTIVADTVEAFVPQMINLHSIGGVNFKKGCYPGQEVVARMHYLGKLKRRMYRAHTDSESLPQAGENLYAAGEDQSAGKVVHAQHSPDGGIDLLAVIQIATAESAPLHVASPDGPQLELKDLPYEVTNEA